MATATMALLGRTTAALTFATAHCHARRKDPAIVPHPSRRARWAAAIVAAAPPAALVTRAACQPGARWQPPPSPTVRTLLTAHVLSSAVIEEVVWRGVLTRRHHPRNLAIASALGFVAAHLPRDGGRSAPAHAVNAVAWTLSASIGRRLRWSVLAHTGYNLAAHTLVAETVPPHV